MKNVLILLKCKIMLSWFIAKYRIFLDYHHIFYRICWEKNSSRELLFFWLYWDGEATIRKGLLNEGGVSSSLLPWGGSFLCFSRFGLGPRISNDNLIYMFLNKLFPALYMYIPNPSNQCDKSTTKARFYAGADPRGEGVGIGAHSPRPVPPEY